MEKKNILDILCDNFQNEYLAKEKIFIQSISGNDFIKYIHIVIIPYLSAFTKLCNLNFDFNIDSENDIIKYKSCALLYLTINSIEDLIKINSKLFESYDDKETAFESYCTYVLYDNIVSWKIKLKLVDESYEESVNIFLKSISEKK